MTTSTIHAELVEFLDKHFPGSTIDDDCFFVSIRASAVSPLIHTEGLQRVADKFCADRYWLVSMDIDPRVSMEIDRIESRTISYKPDWNIEEEKTQWLAELQTGQQANISALNAGRTLASALALFHPTRCLVFDVQYGRVHADSKSGLDEFHARHRRLFRPKMEMIRPSRGGGVGMGMVERARVRRDDRDG